MDMAALSSVFSSPALGHLTPAALATLLAASALLLRMAQSDLRNMVLPDGLTMSLAILGFLSSAGEILPGQTERGALMGAALGGVFFFLIRAWLSRRLGTEALGLGDVKLSFACGALFGPATLLLHMLLTVVFGLWMFVAASRAAERDGDNAPRVIPLGPSMCLSAFSLLAIEAFGFSPGSWLFSI
jgi:leader peptidase (prepilin peptidase)/N-methyltransferase